MQFNKKDILDIASLSCEEITFILDTSEKMKEISQRPIKKVPTLRGKTVVLFFYAARQNRRIVFLRGKHPNPLIIRYCRQTLKRGQYFIGSKHQQHIQRRKPDRYCQKPPSHEC